MKPVFILTLLLSLLPFGHALAASDQPTAPTSPDVADQSQSSRTLWSGPEGSLIARMSDILWETRRGQTVVQPPNYGGPHFTRLVWHRTDRSDSPDLLFVTDGGGSGRCGDDVAVTFGRPPHFRMIGDCGQNAAPPKPYNAHGQFHFTMSIPVMTPFGGPNSASVSTDLPLTWRDGNFALDLPRLANVAFSPHDIQLRRAAIRNETDHFARSSQARMAGLPATTKALLDMIFAGRAEQARTLLHESATSTFNAEFYWEDLCAILVADPNWKRLIHGVMPDSTIVESAAKTGQRERAPDTYAR